MSDFFKPDKQKEKIHQFTISPRLGGGIMEIRELGMSEYDDVVKESSKGMPDGGDGGAKPGMVEMFAYVGVNKARLMRIKCVKSISGVAAWEHEGGPEGFLESLGIKMVTLIDQAINEIHETSEEETAAFISSHRLPGAVAMNSQPEKEYAA